MIKKLKPDTIYVLERVFGKEILIRIWDTKTGKSYYYNPEYGRFLQGSGLYNEFRIANNLNYQIVQEWNND